MSESTAERWLPVVGYEGYYEVSDLGRVRSLDGVSYRADGFGRRVRGRVLKQTLNPRDERWMVSLCRWYPCRQRRRVFFVHRLVLEAFEGPCPPGMESCHNNGDRQDNRRSNLRWGTKPSNAQDTLRHGRNERRNRVSCPLGHKLEAPNLRRSVAEDGNRGCLACARAHGEVNYARRLGHHLDFRATADDHYARILAGTGPVAHRDRTRCPQSHNLAVPNLVRSELARGRRKCLACNRTGSAKQRAARRGEPFDFQAVSDAYYAQIMGTRGGQG